MIYIIKFIYSFILPPGIFLIFLVLFAALLWKKERKLALLLSGFTFVFYVLSTSMISDALVRSLEQQYTPPAQANGDVIIVLGGGATRDTPDFGGFGNLSGGAANRILTAARLYEATRLPIILSGGQVFSDSGNEAEIAKRQLVQLHIPPKVIFIDNRSLNTEQNAQFTNTILTEHGYKHPILITSAFHMPRSVLNFEKAGVTVTPYPVDYWSSREIHVYTAKFTPSAGALSAVATVLKEYIGIMALSLHR